MKTIKILFQGDSVTDEERDRNDPHHLGKGYAKFAAQRLKEVFPQKQLEFLNLGISGNKSGDLLERWEKDCIAVQPDFVEMESDLALIAVVGRGMKSQRGTAGRVFSALAHAHVNVKMIDQGSSELNIIIGVENRDFETAVKAIYDIFVLTQM